VHLRNGVVPLESAPVDTRPLIADTGYLCEPPEPVDAHAADRERRRPLIPSRVDVTFFFTQRSPVVLPLPSFGCWPPPAAQSNTVSSR